MASSKTRMKLRAKKVQRTMQTSDKEERSTVEYTAKQIDETMAELNKVG